MNEGEAPPSADHSREQAMIIEQQTKAIYKLITLLDEIATDYSTHSSWKHKIKQTLDTLSKP